MSVQIYETLNCINTFEGLKSDDGYMRLKGVFGVCGVKNNNKRIYEKDNYGKLVHEMQQRIKNEGVIAGELEHPQTMNITIDRISHVIESIDIDENGVVSGVIKLLNTDKGKQAQECVRGGLKLHISSRATGNVDKDGHVTLENLATYDLVGSPGFSQAKLELFESEGKCVEQLCESVYVVKDKNEKIISENNMNNNMTNEELLSRIEALEARIAKMQDVETYCVEKFAPSVQKWVVEEVAPAIQNWCTKELLPESVNNDDVKEEIKQWFVTEGAAGIQKWICEEFAPEIERWVVESFAPEIENWIVEQYSPEVERWICEEFSDAIQGWVVEEVAPEIQKWICEDYSANVQKWCIESFAPEIQNWIVEEYGNDTKQSSLDKIESLLSTFESREIQKPVYSRKSMINESAEMNANVSSSEPAYIANMPDTARVQWNMANESVKNAIKRKAALYNLNSPTAVNQFWESIDFATIAPSSRVNESINTRTKSAFELGMAKQFARLRK